MSKGAPGHGDSTNVGMTGTRSGLRQIAVSCWAARRTLAGAPVGNGTTVARRVRWRLRQVSPAKGGGVLQPALAHLGNDAVAYP
jgi:hypothetical protein